MTCLCRLPIADDNNDPSLASLPVSSSMRSSNRGASFPQNARLSDKRLCLRLADTPDRAVAEAPRIVVVKHPAAVPQYFHSFVDSLLLSKRSHQHQQSLSSGTAGSTDKQGSRSWLPRARSPAADPARAQEGSVSQTSPDTKLPKRVIVTATSPATLATQASGVRASAGPLSSHPVQCCVEIIEMLPGRRVQPTMW